MTNAKWVELASSSTKEKKNPKLLNSLDTLKEENYFPPPPFYQSSEPSPANQSCAINSVLVCPWSQAQNVAQAS